MALYPPEPTQDVHCHNGNARSGGNTSERLFCAGLAVRESVASDHNRDQTRNFRDSSRKEALDGIEAGVEGTSLGMSSEWGQDENTQHHQRCLYEGRSDRQPNGEEKFDTGQMRH